MSTIYENLLFLGGYVTDPTLFDRRDAQAAPAERVLPPLPLPANAAIARGKPLDPCAA